MLLYVATIMLSFTFEEISVSKTQFYPKMHTYTHKMHPAKVHFLCMVSLNMLWLVN